ncbi:MAG: M23 family metallopeptidase [Anaeromyxobacter sp.]
MLAAALAALLPLLAAAPADPHGALKALEARKRAEETAAKLLAEQERSVLDTLAESERSAAEADAEWHRVEAARIQAQASLARAAQDEESARARQRARLAELRPRLLARARTGAAGELRAMLTATTLADLVKRRYLLSRILDRDLGLLADARAAHDAAERARAEREVEATRLQALAAEAEERREDAGARREERETLLAALKTARGFHERAAAEVASQTRRLADFVATLPPPRTAAAGGDFAARRGRLPAPAPGPVTVPFGRVVNPRFNTVTVQNGVDIAAPKGAPVRAVAPGRVVHAGWFKGYGNLVIVDHGDGFHTLAAHLGSMRTAMGEEVDAGAVLGTVGDSGSLKGAYLYFEVRDHGRPVDPREWLAP